MNRKTQKYIMETMNLFEYAGYPRVWLHAPIIVEVPYRKSEESMWKMAKNKIAKELAKFVRGYNYRLFNKIVFRKYEDNNIILYVISEEKPKRKYTKHKAEPILEYVDLFGVKRQIMDDKTTRIKPIKKGETDD